MAVPKNAFRLDFDGFDQVMKRLEEKQKDTRKIAEEAMIESKKLVNENLTSAMAKHNRTGTTLASLDKDMSMYWTNATTGYIEVGFSISNGGLPSVFLMYGTPKIPPDRKLYNALYGTATRRKLKAKQEEVFYKHMNT